jgi:hypothetical protein
MSWEHDVVRWRARSPKEERLDTVLKVLEHVFQKVEFKRGSVIKITDLRLMRYKKEVRPEDDKVAPDGSFQVHSTNGRTVKGYFLKRILDMIDIVDLCDKYLTK